MSLQYQTTYQIMEEDILNYSPTVMFRGTPCIQKKVYEIPAPEKSEIKTS